MDSSQFVALHADSKAREMSRVRKRRNLVNHERKYESDVGLYAERACENQKEIKKTKKRITRLERFNAQASVIGAGVDVKTSKIPGAGNGLFASKIFVKGDMVTAFNGVTISTKEALVLRGEGKSGWRGGQVCTHMRLQTQI